MGDPTLDWCYMTEPDPGLNGRRLPWPRGKVMGGSSSLNGLLYVRGQAEDYDRWQQMGNAGWGWESVLPYFRRAEDQERGVRRVSAAPAGPCRSATRGFSRRSAMHGSRRRKKAGYPFNPRLQRRDTGRCRIFPADRAQTGGGAARPWPM